MYINKKFHFSELEKKELFKAWVAISFAFSIMMGGFSNFYSFIIMSAFTVGVGFLFHEIAHKFAAQKYNCWAEFRADNKMLFLMILMSFMGVLFAAPGAVMIHGNITKRRNGIISMWGPLTNFILAIIFLVIFFFTSFKTLGFFGAYINSILGMFNMIPFMNIDGKKILVWNKGVYYSMVSLGVVLVFISFNI